MSDLPREFEASRQGPDKPLHDVTADTPSRHRHASRRGERTDSVQDSFVEVTDSEAVITDSFFFLLIRRPEDLIGLMSRPEGSCGWKL